MALSWTRDLAADQRLKGGIDPEICHHSKEKAPVIGFRWMIEGEGWIGVRQAIEMLPAAIFVSTKGRGEGWVPHRMMMTSAADEVFLKIEVDLLVTVLWRKILIELVGLHHEILIGNSVPPWM